MRYKILVKQQVNLPNVSTTIEIYLGEPEVSDQFPSTWVCRSGWTGVEPTERDIYGATWLQALSESVRILEIGLATTFGPDMVRDGLPFALDWTAPS